MQCAHTNTATQQESSTEELTRKPQNYFCTAE